MDGSGPAWAADQQARQARQLRNEVYNAQQAQREARQDTRLANQRADELSAQVDLLRILLLVQWDRMPRARACELLGLTQGELYALETHTVTMAASAYEGGTDATQV